MLTYSRLCKGNSRTFLAIVGMSRRDFMELLPAFKAEEQNHREQKSSGRQRALGGGDQPSLSTVMDRLMFILLYFKLYPTQDLLGVLF